MLELFQDLFPWLLGFYLLDAVVTVRRGQALYAARARAFRRLGPGLHLPGLLPTARLSFALEVPPLWSGGSLWVLAGGERYDPTVIRPDDLEELALAGEPALEREKVRLGDRTVARAPTPAHARALAEQLAAAGSGDAARAARSAAPDLGAVQAALAREAPWTVAVQALATALFLLLFGALPLVAFGGPALQQRMDLLLPALGAAHLGTLGACAGLLRRAGLPWREVAGRLLPLAVFPPYAAHPLVHLRRDAVAGRDPAAVAAALLPAPALRELSRRELVRLAASRAAAAGRLAEAWGERERAWRAALAGAGVAPAEVLAPPPPAAGAAAYCPACAGQYRPGFDTCADCGLALERWPAGAPSR